MHACIILLLPKGAEALMYFTVSFVQDSGARGKVEAMHLDLSSFRYSQARPVDRKKLAFLLHWSGFGSA